MKTTQTITEITLDHQYNTPPDTIDDTHRYLRRQPSATRRAILHLLVEFRDDAQADRRVMRAALGNACLDAAAPRQHLARNPIALAELLSNSDPTERLDYLARQQQLDAVPTAMRTEIDTLQKEIAYLSGFIAVAAGMQTTAPHHRP